MLDFKKLFILQNDLKAMFLFFKLKSNKLFKSLLKVNKTFNSKIKKINKTQYLFNNNKKNNFVLYNNKLKSLLQKKPTHSLRKAKVITMHNSFQLIKYINYVYLNKKDKKKSNSILTKQNKLFLKSLRTNTFDYNTLRGLKKKLKPKLINVFKKSQLLLNKWKRLNEVEIYNYLDEIYDGNDILSILHKLKTKKNELYLDYIYSLNLPLYKKKFYHIAKNLKYKYNKLNSFLDSKKFKRVHMKLMKVVYDAEENFYFDFDDTEEEGELSLLNNFVSEQVLEQFFDIQLLLQDLDDDLIFKLKSAMKTKELIFKSKLINNAFLKSENKKYIALENYVYDKDLNNFNLYFKKYMKSKEFKKFSETKNFRHQLVSYLDNKSSISHVNKLKYLDSKKALNSNIFFSDSAIINLLFHLRIIFQIYFLF